MFLRGNRYLKINLHFSRKIWPTNYGKWCAITTNGSPILIMKKLFQFSLRQIWRQPTSSIWNTFLNLTDTQKRTATCRKNVVSKIEKHLNNFIFSWKTICISIYWHYMTWFSMFKLWFPQQPGVNNYAGILRTNALQKDLPPTPKTESAMSEEKIEVQNKIAGSPA